MGGHSEKLKTKEIVVDGDILFTYEVDLEPIYSSEGIKISQPGKLHTSNLSINASFTFYYTVLFLT